MTPRRIAVLGGGIAGLAAAHRLVEHARSGPPVEVLLLEAEGRLGGTIASERTGGFTVESGPDCFITEKPWAMALCERLGIAGDLIGTREGDRRTYVVFRDRIHPLPEGFLMLAPTDLGALARSPLFSWHGKLRMGLDLVLPRRRGTDDESLASFVRRRLGREALERAADPLVGGIYTADPERLSLRATMPRFVDMEARHRSLILGLRAAARSGPAAARGGAGARYGLFAAHRDGMGALVTAVAQRLPEGVVRLRAPVSALARDGARWRFRAGEESHSADALIVTMPARRAAPLVADLDTGLAADLGAIEYASSATVSLGFRTEQLPGLRGFGFVVPAGEGKPLIACTFASRKFTGRAPEGHELVRAFVGGARRPEMASLPEDVLVTLVTGELRTLVGLTGEPLFARVSRWPQAMPQYAIGHLDRVAAIERRAAALPGFALAGAAYHGVGIPDCVRGGEAAADALVAAGR